MNDSKMSLITYNPKFIIQTVSSRKMKMLYEIKICVGKFYNVDDFVCVSN